MIDVRARVLIAAAGGCAALMFAAPAAADPELPPAPAPVVPAAPAPVVPTAAAVDTVAQAPAAGVPHLPSPEALPPGSTMDPGVMAGAESPNVSYLRDLWRAVQTQEISGREALLLGISQRNLNTPIPAQAPGPNVPITPGGPAPVPVTPPAPAEVPTPVAPPAP
ncbi:MAG: hypothetical protein ACSLFA_12120 [Mycobacterium sp.]